MLKDAEFGWSVLLTLLIVGTGGDSEENAVAIPFQEDIEELSLHLDHCDLQGLLRVLLLYSET